MLWALALDLRNLVAPKSMIPLTNKCTMMSTWGSGGAVEGGKGEREVEGS